MAVAGKLVPTIRGERQIYTKGETIHKRYTNTEYTQ
jgi:hypothetical protein